MTWKPVPIETNSQPTILIHEFVTGGGLVGEPLPESWAAEGAAMRRALAKEFSSIAKVVVTLDPRLPPEEGDWRSIAIESVQQLETLAGRADFTLLIAPESSETLETLTRRLDRAGARLLGSTPDAVALTADKAALGSRLAALKIATPETWILEPGDTLPTDAPYPVVVKPIDGAGSLDSFRVDGPNDPRASQPTSERRIFQRYIPGAAMSATFLMSGDGRSRLLGIGAQGMEILDGRFHYRGGLIPSPRPESEPVLTQAVQSIAGLRGLVGVDFVWEPSHRGTVILEINPRPTTSCVGILELLPRGELAQVWLGDGPRSESWDAAVDRIVRRIAASAPLLFDATGRTRLMEQGTEMTP